MIGFLDVIIFFRNFSQIFTILVYLELPDERHGILPNQVIKKIYNSKELKMPSMI